MLYIQGALELVSMEGGSYWLYLVFCVTQLSVIGVGWDVFVFASGS